jgi:Icc-related predicted phosphoesterase
MGNDDIETPLSLPMDGHNFHGITNDVVQLEDGVGFLEFSYVPPTPFLTRYERNENELKQMLELLFEALSEYKFRIAMCHAPPYRTNLDITKDWYPGGEEIQVHAGRKTVRKLIKTYQPDVGLFGHPIYKELKNPCAL